MLYFFSFTSLSSVTSSSFHELLKLPETLGRVYEPVLISLGPPILVALKWRLHALPTSDGKYIMQARENETQKKGTVIALFQKRAAWSVTGITV